MRENVARRFTVLAAGGLMLAVACGASSQGSEQSATKPRDLPAAVLSAFHKAYPGATVSGASQEREGDKVVFRVDSVDKGLQRIVLYDPSGSTIEVAEQVQEKDLPQPVARAMHSHRRAVFARGMRVSRGGGVLYVLTITGTRKTALVVKADGTVVSIK